MCCVSMWMLVCGHCRTTGMICLHSCARQPALYPATAETTRGLFMRRVTIYLRAPQTNLMNSFTTEVSRSIYASCLSLSCLQSLAVLDQFSLPWHEMPQQGWFCGICESIQLRRPDRNKPSVCIRCCVESVRKLNHDGLNFANVCHQFFCGPGADAGSAVPRVERQRGDLPRGTLYGRSKICAIRLHTHISYRASPVELDYLN